MPVANAGASFVAYCHACGWRSLPTPYRRDAQAALAEHGTTCPPLHGAKEA